MKRPTISSVLLLAFTTAAFGSETLREISWEKLQEADALSAGQVVSCPPGETGQALKIENPDDAKKTFTVLTIDAPSIRTSRYAVAGKVRYQDVAARSYLEMWSCFPDGGQYFSRTLASRGLLGSIEGSSDWRDFSLPFTINHSPSRPEKLVVNVVLTGRGTVWLSPPSLVQYAENEDPLAAPGAWWDDRTGGLIGGIGGSILGCLGGLIGALGGLGKARRLTTQLAVLTMLIGVAALATGIVALALRQPYGVYYPLLLGGGIATAVMGGCLPTLRRRYQQIELQKMTALEVGRA